VQVSYNLTANAHREANSFIEMMEDIRARLHGDTIVRGLISKLCSNFMAVAGNCQIWHYALACPFKATAVPKDISRSFVLCGIKCALYCLRDQLGLKAKNTKTEDEATDALRVRHMSATAIDLDVVGVACVGSSHMNVSSFCLLILESIMQWA